MFAMVNFFNASNEVNAINVRTNINFKFTIIFHD